MGASPFSPGAHEPPSRVGAVTNSAGWPPMIWIGGAQGAGKSTIARDLARANDLPWHPIDLWTYDHVARMPPISTLAEDLAGGPEVAAAAFVDYGRRRLPLVIEDVRARGVGEVAAVVEGPQLAPSDTQALPPGHSVWLVPSTERTRLAREERLSRAGQTSDASRLQSLTARDAILAAGIRDLANELRLPVVMVSEDVDWPTVAEQVRGALAPALDSPLRLAPGEPLGAQRRFENLTAGRQGRLWQQAAGIERLPEFPFGCECGSSGCSAVWSTRPDDYDLAAAEGPVVSEGHVALWGW